MGKARSLYFRLAVRANFLLRAPHADAFVVEEVLAGQSNTGLLGFKGVTTDRATEWGKYYSSWMPKSFSYSNLSSCSNLCEDSPFETEPIFSSNSSSSCIGIVILHRSCCQYRHHHPHLRTSSRPAAPEVRGSAHAAVGPQDYPGPYYV